jgi:uridine kinase
MTSVSGSTVASRPRWSGLSSRSQEGLPPADTIAAYERIYFPAERVHFERDRPRDSADLVFVNDEHLE